MPEMTAWCAVAVTRKLIIIDEDEYQWTRSNGGINEYYLEALGGGEVALPQGTDYDKFLWINGYPYVRSDNPGALAVNRWSYSRNPEDPIGFDTIYVRLSSPISGSSYDPDGMDENGIEYKLINNGASENFEE